ncbi:hypothetical protein niasHT_029923 [Heterodera trifolii]|uniref:RGS domain-containing protein n=1 Tax=Heterodera trifolii TaxID=157864 RepID=A0ABD2KBY8_9BILA
MKGKQILTTEVKKKLISEYDQLFVTQLGIVYVLRWKWHCPSLRWSPVTFKKERNDELRQCQKFSEYARILYNYLFVKYLQAANQELAAQFFEENVKPRFKFAEEAEEIAMNLFDLTRSLSGIWKFYFNSKERKKYKRKLSIFFNYSSEPILLNENEFKKNDEGMDGSNKTAAESSSQSLAANEQKDNADNDLLKLMEDKFKNLLKKMEKIAQKMNKTWNTSHYF